MNSLESLQRGRRDANLSRHLQVLFEAQAPTFQMSVPAVANSLSGGLFMQGIGGLVAVPLVQRFGRLPVLFWSQFLSAIVVTGAAVSPNYASFTAFRTLQGFVNTPPQVIGLSIVNDL
jgi:MFS family permease